MIRGPAVVAIVAGFWIGLSVALPKPVLAQTKLKPGRYPINITKSGSYVLTDNLEPGNKNSDAIDVSTSNVTIDLNGFSIKGPNLSGSGVGIDASGQDSVTVQNGSVSKMGAGGVIVGNYGVVRNLRSIGNGTSGSGAGIQCTGTSCLFENCVASGNGSPGLVFLDTSSGYQNDVIIGNTGGTVSSGTNMGANVCNNSATCP